MLETRKGRGGRSTTPFEVDDWQLGDIQNYINAESFKGFVAKKEDGEEGWEDVGGSSFLSSRLAGSSEEGII